MAPNGNDPVSPENSARLARAWILLAATLLLYLSPLALRGEVIFPHDNGFEVGAPQPADARWVSNRKFSDLSSCYIPELHEQLHSERRAWIATWNPHIELGRPAPHTFGFTRAFAITRVLALLTDSPFVLYTLYALLTVTLTAAFMFLFLRALGLEPFACYYGAASLATGVFVSYWMSFAMFVATLCWVACLLWLVTRFVERPSWKVAAGIAFATYCLLLTAYPQQLIHHAYLLTGYSLWRLCRARKGMRQRLGLGAMLGSAVALGVVSTSPVLADLLLNAARSTRWDIDRSYFLDALPAIERPSDLGRLLAGAVDAWVYGNPIRPESQVAFEGFSVGPVSAVLLTWSLFAVPWRTIWPWVAFCAAAVLFTVWPSAFAFGVDHLGFDVSRFSPLASALLPLAVIAAHCANHLLSRTMRMPFWVLVAGLAPLVHAAAVYAVDSRSLATGSAAASAALGLGALLFGVLRHRAVIAALALGGTLVQGLPLILSRPESTIAKTSPLIELLQQRTHDGHRYALVAARVPPPNQEGVLGTRSIHAFDSMSSRDYQQFARDISAAGAMNFGRNFPVIDTEEKLGTQPFALAGVATLVSTRPLPPSGFRRLGEYFGMEIYEPLRRPALEAQWTSWIDRGSGEMQLPEGPCDGCVLPTARLENLDDHLELQLTRSAAPTLLFLSQQFHPSWVAHADGKRLQTVKVNGFYQGVIVPPDGERVSLAYRPNVLWSWVPQVFYALLALAWIATWALRAALFPRAGAPGGGH